MSNNKKTLNNKLYHSKSQKLLHPNKLISIEKQFIKKENEYMKLEDLEMNDIQIKKLQDLYDSLKLTQIQENNKYLQLQKNKRVLDTQLKNIKKLQKQLIEQISNREQQIKINNEYETIPKHLLNLRKFKPQLHTPRLKVLESDEKLNQQVKVFKEYQFQHQKQKIFEQQAFDDILLNILLRVSQYLLPQHYEWMGQDQSRIIRVIQTLTSNYDEKILRRVRVNINKICQLYKCENLKQLRNQLEAEKLKKSNYQIPK